MAHKPVTDYILPNAATAADNTNPVAAEITDAIHQSHTIQQQHNHNAFIINPFLQISDLLADTWLVRRLAVFDRHLLPFAGIDGTAAVKTVIALSLLAVLMYYIVRGCMGLRKMKFSFRWKSCRHHWFPFLWQDIALSRSSNWQCTTNSHK